MERGLQGNLSVKVRAEIATTSFNCKENNEIVVIKVFFLRKSHLKSLYTIVLRHRFQSLAVMCCGCDQIYCGCGQVYCVLLVWSRLC